MNPETVERISSLAFCLDGALAVLDEQVRIAEAHEAQRLADQELMRQQAPDRDAFPSPPEEEKLDARLGELMEIPWNGLHTAQELAARWESALGEAEDHLMHLWADPELRLAVEAIAEGVRTARKRRAVGPDESEWRQEARRRLQQEHEAMREPFTQAVTTCRHLRDGHSPTD